MDKTDMLQRRIAHLEQHRQRMLERLDRRIERMKDKANGHKRNPDMQHGAGKDRLQADHVAGER